MKKTILLYFLLAQNLILFSQNIVELDEIRINNKIKITDILIKVKKAFKKNCLQDGSKYIFFQSTTNFNDTILNVKNLIQLQIKAFDGTFSKKTITTSNITADKTIALFRKLSDKESPNHWISYVPVAKNLNLKNLDFFKNPQKYLYNVYRDSLYTIVEFSSKEYEGRFQFKNTNHNIKFLYYRNIIAQENSQTNIKNLKIDFESNWVNSNENVKIAFSENNNKIVLDSLEIIDDIKDYKYQQYDKKSKVVNSGVYYFRTKINMHRYE